MFTWTSPPRVIEHCLALFALPEAALGAFKFAVDLWTEIRRNAWRCRGDVVSLGNRSARHKLVCTGSVSNVPSV
jgi:hypothetical protein